MYIVHCYLPNFLQTYVSEYDTYLLKYFVINIFYSMLVDVNNYLEYSVGLISEITYIFKSLLYILEIVVSRRVRTLVEAKH